MLVAPSPKREIRSTVKMGKKPTATKSLLKTKNILNHHKPIKSLISNTFSRTQKKPAVAIKLPINKLTNGVGTNSLGNLNNNNKPKQNYHSTVNSGNFANIKFTSKKLNTNLIKEKTEKQTTALMNNKKTGNIGGMPYISSNQPNVINTSKASKKPKPKQIVTTTNSIEKIVLSTSNKHSKKNEYAKIFGLINNEIKEITDLFKRTQSVDTQKKNGSVVRIETDIGGDVDIDSSIFEKELSEEANGEKNIDISNLENCNDIESILFSSYNSDFYKNLMNDNNGKVNVSDKSEDFLYGCSSVSSRNINTNVIKIAQNNINEIKNLNAKDDSDGSEKTECQYDVAFGDCENRSEDEKILDDLEKTEKTCNLNEEKEDYIIRSLPIQEVMKKLRENATLKNN